MNTAFALLLIAASWLDAGSLKKNGPVRPKPIEPDVTSNRGGGFRLPEVKVEPKLDPVPVESIVAPVDVRPSAPDVPKLPTWRPDANGNWWARDNVGNLYFGPDSTTVRTRGQPVNP